MDDLILRKAAIDALDALCDRECEYSKKQRNVMCGACHLGSAFDAIEQLPSAQSVEKDINVPCKDTISRQAAIDAVNAYLGLSAVSRTIQNMTSIQEILKKLPSAQPDLCDGCDRYGESCVGEGCGKLEMSEVAKDTNVPINDCISRHAAIDALSLGKEILSRVLDDIDVVGTDREKYSWGLKLIESNINDIEELPSAQPEQRYTEEELKVFQHGISLSLLSKRSAQHWQYDEDTATEIKFLERLYEKVGADMRGEQDE